MSQSALSIQLQRDQEMRRKQRHATGKPGQKMAGSKSVSDVSERSRQTSVAGDKKQPVVSGPPIAMSDAFRANVQAAEAALKARDAATAGTRISGLSPSNDFESYVAAGLRFQLAAQRNDVQAKRIALTDMFKKDTLKEVDQNIVNERPMVDLEDFGISNSSTELQKRKTGVSTKLMKKRKSPEPAVPVQTDPYAALPDVALRCYTLQRAYCQLLQNLSIPSRVLKGCYDLVLPSVPGNGCIARTLFPSRNFAVLALQFHSD